MAVDPDTIPAVWMRSIRWHTYKRVPQPEGSYYLMQEPTAEIQEMLIDSIENVSKFAVRDKAPKKATRTPDAIPVTPAPVTPVPAPVEPRTAERPPDDNPVQPQAVEPMTTAKWPTPSSTTFRGIDLSKEDDQ